MQEEYFSDVNQVRVAPPKKKVMNSPAGTKGTVGTLHIFLTHTCVRIIGIESTA